MTDTTHLTRMTDTTHLTRPLDGDDVCPPDECVWQVIEEAPAGTIVECVDCGAEGIAEASS